MSKMKQLNNLNSFVYFSILIKYFEIKNVTTGIFDSTVKI